MKTRVRIEQSDDSVNLQKKINKYIRDLKDSIRVVDIKFSSFIVPETEYDIAIPSYSALIIYEVYGVE